MNIKQVVLAWHSGKWKSVLSLYSSTEKNTGERKERIKKEKKHVDLEINHGDWTLLYLFLDEKHKKHS